MKVEVGAGDIYKLDDHNLFIEIVSEPYDNYSLIYIDYKHIHDVRPIGILRMSVIDLVGNFTKISKEELVQYLLET